MIDTFDVTTADKANDGLWHESVPMTSDVVDALYGTPIQESPRDVLVDIEVERALGAIARQERPMTVLQALVEVGVCEVPDLLVHTGTELADIRAQLVAFEAAGIVVSDELPGGSEVFKVSSIPSSTNF